MSSIQVYRSSNTSSTFGFQDAETSGSCVSFSMHPTFNLYDNGCIVNNTLDCSIACQDADLIFASPYTLQNCLVMVALKGLLALDGLNPQTIGAESSAVVHDFSIDLEDPRFPILADEVVQIVQDCLGQFCETIPGCDSAVTKNYDFNCYDGHSFNEVCASVVAPLNADIGGIGVYTSYWMQSGIALSAFILLKLCDNLFFRLCMLMYYLLWPLAWRFAWPFGLAEIRQRVRYVQSGLRKHLAALKSATVEFHKAQCFFMLAIEVAAKVVVKQGLLNDGTTTLQGLFNNYRLVGNLAISGLLPVTFTLLSLHNVGLNSRYLFALSSCTIAMSAVTLFSIGDFKITLQDLQKLTNATTSEFHKCGARNPSTFCLDHANTAVALTSMNLEKGAIGGYALVLSLLIMVLLIMDHAGMQDSPMYKRFLKGSLTRIGIVLQSKNRQPSGFLQIFRECLYATIWACYIVLFAYFLKGLAHSGNSTTITPATAWTFGQIVAITVWAVPLFEFAKLLGEGVEEGLDYRIPFPYTVVNTEDKAAEPYFRVWFKWNRPDRSIKPEPDLKIF